METLLFCFESNPQRQLTDGKRSDAANLAEINFDAKKFLNFFFQVQEFGECRSQTFAMMSFLSIF
jgi:hypothetical protein